MEGTLSIHTIVTGRREAFHWLAIGFTFALGTAVGDLVNERLGLGTTVTSLVFLAVILAVVSYLAVTRRDQLPPVERAEAAR